MYYIKMTSPSLGERIVEISKPEFDLLEPHAETLADGTARLGANTKAGDLTIKLCTRGQSEIREPATILTMLVLNPPIRGSDG